jgi:hypothetical protein
MFQECRVRDAADYRALGWLTISLRQPSTSAQAQARHSQPILSAKIAATTSNVRNATAMVMASQLKKVTRTAASTAARNNNATSTSVQNSARFTNFARHQEVQDRE